MFTICLAKGKRRRWEVRTQQIITLSSYQLIQYAIQPPLCAILFLLQNWCLEVKPQDIESSYYTVIGRTHTATHCLNAFLLQYGFPRMKLHLNDTLVLKPWLSVNLAMQRTLRPDVNIVGFSCNIEAHKRHNWRQGTNGGSTNNVGYEYDLDQTIRGRPFRG